MSGPFDSLLEPTEKKSQHVATVGLDQTSGRYRLGPPVRPNIQYDNGHLGKYPHREPTASDRALLAKWIAMLNAAEAACTAVTGEYIEKCHWEDQSDALAAYRHFLYGNGADRTVDYERYLKSDPSGASLVEKIINDFRTHAEVIGKDRIKFSVTSEPYTVALKDGFTKLPVTVNWQRTLGAHYLWVSANVVVSADYEGTIWYHADLTIHVEDRYNFNPDEKDISTGIPDWENGQFEITGLAKQYMNFATVIRHTKWAKGEREYVEILPPSTSRAKGRK